jgi:hypothetical protein
MNRLERRQRQICKAFIALHKEKFSCNYSDLMAGKHGEVKPVKEKPKESVIFIDPEKTIDGKFRNFFFEPAEPKKHGGQPLLFDDERRVEVSLRLPRWVKGDLQNRDGTMTKLIEDAVIIHYDMKKGEA